MITARFHPHLLAARHGAVGIYRPDEAYYQVKHGSIAALGSSFKPFDAARGLRDQMPTEAGADGLLLRQGDLVAQKRRVVKAIMRMI